ncbi:hypothetical protein [Ilumatobacter sp.]|uniref:hypothetical protein n=1 Tax=Ilumatobacter sp. TaxID=1967498 RepID=UPI003751B5BB
MPRSRPPMYDDGGGLPDVARGEQRHDPSRGRDSVEGHDNRRRGVPNFLIRRAIVVGLVVVLIAVASIVAGNLLGSADGGSGSAFGDSDWNTIVSIDKNIGAVVLTDADGEETGRFRLGIQSLTDSSVIGSTVIAASTDSIAVADLSAPDDIATIDIESAGELVRPSGTVATVIAPDIASERVVLVHGPTREVIDTADLDTVPGARYDIDLARSDPTGRNVLVTDSGNFQSVLFSFDRDAPSFFPGLALAVNDSIVVTAQNVGTNANINVFDHDGEAGVSTQTASVRAGMISGGNVILIGVEGEVLSLSIASGEVTTLDSLSVGTVQSGNVAPRGDRLIVRGDQGTAIVDGDGLVIADLPGAQPTTTGIDKLAPRRSTCVILARAATNEIMVVDLDDGAIRIEALAQPEVLADVSGCLPVVPTSAGYLSLTPDAVQPVTLVGDVLAISPDGGTLVVENNNRLLLTERAVPDSDPADPVDIGRAGRSVAFADL